MLTSFAPFASILAIPIIVPIFVSKRSYQQTCFDLLFNQPSLFESCYAVQSSFNLSLLLQKLKDIQLATDLSRALIKHPAKLRWPASKKFRDQRFKTEHLNVALIFVHWDPLLNPCLALLDQIFGFCVVDRGWISWHFTLACVNLEKSDDHRQVSKPGHPEVCEVADDAVANREDTPTGNNYVEDLLIAHRVNFQVLVDIDQNLHVNVRLRHGVGVRVASDGVNGVEVVNGLRVVDVK